jgi:hypothetical protein
MKLLIMGSSPVFRHQKYCSSTLKGKITVFFYSVTTHNSWSFSHSTLFVLFNKQRRLQIARYDQLLDVTDTKWTNTRSGFIRFAKMAVLTHCAYIKRIYVTSWLVAVSVTWNDKTRSEAEPNKRKGKGKGKKKLKLSLFLAKHHAIKTYWEVEVQLQAFLTLR